MEPGEHLDLLLEAMRIEGQAQRRLLAGRRDEALTGFREAAGLYRRSWELAPPLSFGRLIGMTKAATIAGDGAEEATYVRQALGDACDSPASSYALAIAALLSGDDGAALSAAEGMRAGDGAFCRAADAISAIAEGSADAYRRAVRAIVCDFEGRQEHLTGVPIADTALMLDTIAARRGMAARPTSPLLPVL